MILSVLAVLAVATLFWSTKYPTADEKRKGPTPITLAYGGVLIERDLNVPLPIRPGFGAFDKRWSALGFSWHEYERLFDAPDRAAGAVPIPAAHSKGPDYFRWYFVHKYQSWCIPLWPLALALSAVSILRWVKYARRGQRLTLELSERCGYDLRATPERCPECGTARVRE